jgi:hypothetical protein
VSKRTSILAFVAFVLLVGSSGAAAQASKGFATYKVSVNSPLGEHSAIINETVDSSAKAGYSDLILQFIGGEQNLTYSKLVNSSESLFPYLPSVANQTFEYANGTAYKIRVNVSASGTTTVTFKGNQYTLSVLTVTASVSFGNRSIDAKGTVETFPTTLVYSASVGNSTYGIQAVLLATDLPLVPSSSQMTTAAYVGAGATIGAVAIGGTFLLRRREKKADKHGEKPLHWVD